MKRAAGLVGAAEVNHWPGRDHRADARRRARAGFTLDAIEWAPWLGIADPACPNEPSSSTTYPDEAKARVDAMRAEGLTVLINVINANGCAQWRQGDSYVRDAVDFISTKIGSAGVILSGVSEPGVRGSDPKSLRWTKLALSLWDGLVAIPGSSGHPYWPALEHDLLDDHVCSDASAIAALERGDKGVLVNTDCSPVLDPGPARAAELARAAVAHGSNLLVYGFAGIREDTIDAMAAEIQGAGAGQAITADHKATFLAVEQCTGLEAPDPLEQAFPLKACPTSGRLCCMDDPRFPDFVAANGKLAGYAGSFDGDRTIDLPAGTPCGDAFDHEAWRYLLRANGDPRWDDFDLPNLPAGC